MIRIPLYRLLALVAVILTATLGLPALNTSAGGGPQNVMRFEVQPSLRITPPAVWPDTTVFYRSSQTTQLERGTWFRPGMTASSGPITVGPVGQTVNLSGDPNFWYFATGTWLNYPDGTRNAFAMAQWAPSFGCDAPRMSVVITDPRTASASAKATIDNRDGNGTLFITDDGQQTTVLVGDFYTSSSKQLATITVVSGDIQCETLHWNVTPAWIEGIPAAPTVSSVSIKDGIAAIQGNNLLPTDLTMSSSVDASGILAAERGADFIYPAKGTVWGNSGITFSWNASLPKSGQLKVCHGSINLCSAPISYTVSTTPKLAASIEVGNVPTTWTKGQAQTVKVTVTNTGTETWSASGDHKAQLVGFFLDGPMTQYPGEHWIHQSIVPIPQDLAPSQSVTLFLTMHTPPTACCHQMGFQMMLKGRTALPDAALVNITIH